MKKFFLMGLTTTLALVMGTACSGNSQKTETTAQEETTQTTVSVDDVFANADNLAGQEITLEGVCTHTCAHGATKIFIQGSDNSQLIRCEAGVLGAFSKECVHSVVRVTGTLVETRMDEEYLQRWEQQYEEERNQEGYVETEASTASSGCETESTARQEQGNTVAERIENYRKKIAEREAAEGKAYLSFYHVQATAYEVVTE